MSDAYEITDVVTRETAEFLEQTDAILAYDSDGILVEDGHAVVLEARE